eukprot:GHVP01039711.1.p2 GENE.GHVP01039711.1~~GHVP01039711.1.p2  ORF type:complete len:163 (+),score=40.17 GHVP01039711.1:1140-1628(+)
MEQEPVTIHTIILPPGVHMNDPRLRDAKFKSQQTYFLDKNSDLELPLRPFVADVDSSLEHAFPGVEGFEGEDVSAQVINPTFLQESIYQADLAIENGMAEVYYTRQEHALPDEGSIPVIIDKQRETLPPVILPVGTSVPFEILKPIFNSTAEKLGVEFEEEI